MKIGIFAAIIIYYLIAGLFFLTMTDTFTGFTATGNLTSMASDYSGGSSSILDTIGSLFLFVTFGLGLPSDTPSWFKILFSAWSVFLTICTALILYQAVRGS